MMMRNKKDRVFSRGVEIEVCKRPDPKIRLYDYRLIQIEPLQSYEGHVNSRTCIQLGVDPYERFFMSGEEDCNLRLWSIKSSELLFEDNFMDFVPSIVCWLKAHRSWSCLGKSGNWCAIMVFCCKSNVLSLQLDHSDIEVHGNGYSHAIEETASPVVHANRLVSAVGSSLSEMVKPEAYSQNSESDFPHFVVDENTAERSSTERLTESSSESAQPIHNGFCEEGKISRDAPVGNLSSGELLDEISPVDCNSEQAKMETGKGLPSSSSTKDAIGKLARRNSSEGKWKPLFPPGFLRKHSGNNSPKRGGKAKAPLELAECASSYNPNKVISGFAKLGFLNQNGARTKDVGKSHSKCSSSSSPTFEERVGNHLDKDVMVLSGSGDFNHCNGDSGAFVISDEGISYISGDDQQLAGKTSSYKEVLHESKTAPEKIRTDSEKPRASRRSSMRVLMSCGFCSASSSLSMILGLMVCGFFSSFGSMILGFVMECVFSLLELPKTELEGVVWMILGFMGWGCGGGGSCF